MKKVPRDVVIRQRRKMKKLAALVGSGELSVGAFREQYLSWRGDKRRYDAQRALGRMDVLYQNLYRQMLMKNQEILQEKQAERTDLISQLTSPYSPIGDWKLNKQEEAVLLGQEPPYSDAVMQEYGAARKAARERINALEKEIAALETGA